METAIQVVWWIGLIGALIPTVVILKEVALVLRTLRNIHTLAEDTRNAARGIVRHAGAVPRVAALEEPAGELREAAGALASSAAEVERELGALAPGTSRQGG